MYLIINLVTDFKRKPSALILYIARSRYNIYMLTINDYIFKAKDFTSFVMHKFYLVTSKRIN